MSEQLSCRICGHHDLKSFLDLGVTPLADRLLEPEELHAPEPTYPLEVAFCPNCSLVQILETVEPDELFDGEVYHYYSSFSPMLLEHSRQNVHDLIARRNLTESSFIIELASNDGYLLKNYTEQGIQVLGIDPCAGPAQAAESIGVPTMVTYFTLELAQKLLREGKRADVIHANNVLAHIPDTNGFVAGIGTLLKDEGVAVIEAPYLKELIDHCEFDTIYHEHLCYFSVTALDKLFRRHSLYLNDVKELGIHGGSLRLYVEKCENVSDNVRRLLAAEKEIQLDKIDYYQDFSKRVLNVKTTLMSLLSKLKDEGKKLAAYGAAAKGATLINYVGIGGDLVEFVVDRNVHKQGKFMPGKHIPVYGPEKILEKMPDYVLILPWNFTDEILAQQKEYRSRGGKFIIPIPEPRII